MKLSRYGYFDQACASNSKKVRKMSPQPSTPADKLQCLRDELRIHSEGSITWMEKVITTGLGYTSARDWQAPNACHLYNGTDVFLTTKTGSGKSVLIHAPILARMVSRKPHIGIAVIPTRALMDNQVRIVCKLHMGNVRDTPEPNITQYIGDRSQKEGDQSSCHS
jgi:superfamily II DNA/RNA helicase